jgi:hypothetical protein
VPYDEANDVPRVQQSTRVSAAAQPRGAALHPAAKSPQRGAFGDARPLRGRGVPAPSRWFTPTSANVTRVPLRYRKVARPPQERRIDPPPLFIQRRDSRREVDLGVALVNDNDFIARAKHRPTPKPREKVGRSEVTHATDALRCAAPAGGCSWTRSARTDSFVAQKSRAPTPMPLAIDPARNALALVPQRVRATRRWRTSCLNN